MSDHANEMARGDRFGFGDNWRKFLELLDDGRITEAEISLKTMLGMESFSGLSFLDIGSGSGLFSLAARRLGAVVHSVDYDPQSVACTKYLKSKYFPEDKTWKISEASVLNDNNIRALGEYDVVYSWGVLHHTGEMWTALENAALPVKNHGKLFISIYNDQGSWSKIWKIIKQIYNKLPHVLQTPYALMIMLPREMRMVLRTLLVLKPQEYVYSWTRYKSVRGMSRWRDLIDWVGGYPFEVAKPEEIFEFYKKRNFELRRLVTCGGGLGCNEFVLEKMPINKKQQSK